MNVNVDNVKFLICSNLIAYHCKADAIPYDFHIVIMMSYSKETHLASNLAISHSVFAACLLEIINKLIIGNGEYPQHEKGNSRVR